MSEIRGSARIIVDRINGDGGSGHAKLLSNKTRHWAVIVFSWSGGWDHVSVSFNSRYPTWEEMNEVRSLLFRPDECVVQYQPGAEDFFDDYPYCLHLWRKQGTEMPQPPSQMSGWRMGRMVAEARLDAKVVNG